MPVTSADLLARLAHLASLVFTEVLLVGVAVAVVSWAVARRIERDEDRARVLLGGSLVVLAWLVTPALAVVWLVYAVVFHALVERCPRGPGIAGATVLLLAMIVAPVHWIGALGDLGGPRVRELTAFGTNMALLRCAAYAVDRWWRGAPALGLEGFLLGSFFFPTFVNGPIEPPHRLAGPWPRPSRDDLLAGVRRIVVGAGKMLLVALLFPPAWTAALGTEAEAPAWRLWVWSLLLYGWFYLSFSAWSDTAIGLGRVCGRVVVENFDRPWMARDPGDFWRRWHVSLGLWLRDYVYVPLGGNRRHRAANVAVVFLVSALWHVWGTLKLLGFGYFPMRAWWGFLVWGAVHAVAVVLASHMRRATLDTPGLARVLTLLFAAWAWLPFFTPAGVDLAAGLRMMLRMLVPGVF